MYFLLLHNLFDSIFRKYAKEDNVNSNIFYMNIHGQEFAEVDQEDNTTEYMATMKFIYLDVRFT